MSGLVEVLVALDALRRVIALFRRRTVEIAAPISLLALRPAALGAKVRLELRRQEARVGLELVEELVASGALDKDDLTAAREVAAALRVSLGRAPAIEESRQDEDDFS